MTTRITDRGEIAQLNSALESGLALYQRNAAKNNTDNVRIVSRPRPRFYLDYLERLARRREEVASRSVSADGDRVRHSGGGAGP